MSTSPRVSDDDSSDAKGKQFVSKRWLYKGENGYVGQRLNWIDRPTINRRALTSAIDYGYDENDLRLNGTFVYSNVEHDVELDGLGATFNLNYRRSRQWKTKLNLT
ncbi:MAG: hypothetical protein HRU25_05995 [Psychrobium sp.]|nr:hypothetical protein [Psychrobium sp.]